MDKVSPELQPFCRSLVDPDRPEWYVIHRDGYLYYEPEYAPRNPDTFDLDTSWIFHYGRFFSDDFCSLTLLNDETRYVVAGSDDRLRLAEFQDTEEFKYAASFHDIHYHIKRKSAYVCLTCIFNKKN